MNVNNMHPYLFVSGVVAFEEFKGGNTKLYCRCSITGIINTKNQQDDYDPICWIITRGKLKIKG